MFEARETVLKALEQIGYEKKFMVTFQKSDDTWRTIYCKMPVPDKPKFDEPKSIPVWDLRLDDWRSFSVDRVHTITSDPAFMEW